jgi:hypothetical protein
MQSVVTQSLSHRINLPVFTLSIFILDLLQKHCKITKSTPCFQVIWESLRTGTDNSDRPILYKWSLV